MSTKLLINESPLQVLPSLVKLIGLSQAIVLQQIQYLTTTREAFERDGRRWIKINYAELANACGHTWSEKTIANYVRELEADGYLISAQFGKSEWDRAKSYTIDYPKLESSIVPNTGASMNVPNTESSIVPNAGGSCMNSIKDSCMEKNNTKERERGNAALLPARDGGLSSKSDKEKTSSHPTIQAVRRLLKRYPNAVTHPAIIEAIGDNLDNAKLEQCAAQWALRGFNLLNLGWIYDWYVNGIPADKRQEENARLIKEKQERAARLAQQRAELKAQGLL